MKTLGAAPPPKASTGSSPKTFAFPEPSGLELQIGDYGAGTSGLEHLLPQEEARASRIPAGAAQTTGPTSEAGAAARPALGGQAGSGLISTRVRPPVSAEDAGMHSAPCPQSPPGT